MHHSWRGSRGIGEDEVDGGFGDEGEEFEAVALVEADVVLGIVEGFVSLQDFGGGGWMVGGFGHGGC